MSLIKKIKDYFLKFFNNLKLGSNSTQSLELEVLPIIPLWLQLAIIALIAALIALLLSLSPPQHLASVNSVDVAGTSLSVVSGSDDCTLRT